MSFRTDRNNNPTAFTTNIAEQAGLKYGVDYVDGESFPAPSTFKTAKLLGDPVEITIRVINEIGFYTRSLVQRWTYIGLPKQIWNGLCHNDKILVIGFMYQNEGGTEMKHLFGL